MEKNLAITKPPYSEHILKVPWPFVIEVPMHKYMDDVTGNLFSLFCSTWRAVLKMVVRLRESLEKSLKGVIYKD